MLTAAALAALPQPPALADTAESAEGAIRSALEQWKLAFNNRDEGHVCDLFASDLIANYQGQPELNYASLCQLLRSSLQDSTRTYHYYLKINEIMVYGDLAIVRLVWILDTERGGAPKETIEESAVDIFRRQEDGGWKISRYLAYPASP
jgi:steroid delta-isomerase